MSGTQRQLLGSNSMLGCHKSVAFAPVQVADCGMLAREEMTEVQQPGEEEGERVTTTVTKAQYGKIRWGAAAER